MLLKPQFLPGFHRLFGRAKKTALQQWKDDAKRHPQGYFGQLESLFGDEVQAPDGKASYQRVFDPKTTFWLFLGQVLRGDSCRAATREAQSLRQRNNLSSISSANVAYCKARRRLPLEQLEAAAQGYGRKLQDRTVNDWSWQQRRVLLVDGTSCQLPDTTQNQRAFPQPTTQKQGCEFPVAQLVGVFDLGSGGFLNWEVSPWNVNEGSLFELTLKPTLQANDVVVGDRAYCTYSNIGWLHQNGADAVFRLHQARDCPLKKGQQEAIVSWKRPWPGLRPDYWTEDEWRALPKELTVRYIRVRLESRGFRTKEVILATTLMDVPAEEIARLYLRRWQIEVSFRDLKTTMGMEMLKGKTPAMITREIAMFALAYNLIRGLMMRAAVGSHQKIEAMSFKGSVDSLHRWIPLLEQSRNSTRLNRTIENLLRSIAIDALPQRPHRTEPRVLKRRPKSYQLMTSPRQRMKVSESRRQKGRFTPKS